MTSALRDTLIEQFRTARQLLDYHLADLTTEECLWSPAEPSLALRPAAQSDEWLADWPEDERYTIGPPSAGWTTWHLGYWLSTALDQNFGAGNLAREAVHWPGTGPAAAEWIAQLADRWLGRFEVMDDHELMTDGAAQWPYPSASLAKTLAWSTVELTKNAAELGMARFLFAVRGS